MRKRNRILIIFVLLLGFLIGAVAFGFVPVLAGVDSRPQPPTIQVYGFPDPQGGEPVECAGQPNCGLMCFYISEDAVTNQYELSCVPWIFE